MTRTANIAIKLELKFFINIVQHSPLNRRINQLLILLRFIERLERRIFGILCRLEALQIELQGVLCVACKLCQEVKFLSRK